MDKLHVPAPTGVVLRPDISGSETECTLSHGRTVLCARRKRCDHSTKGKHMDVAPLVHVHNIQRVCHLSDGGLVSLAGCFEVDRDVPAGFNAVARPSANKTIPS